jgi:pyruvate formate lyase activating enzyme
MGYAVKLDTNGTNPAFLKRIVEAGLVDYIAMDVKGPEDLYDRIAGVRVDLEAIRRSIKLIMELPVAYEFRTTLSPLLRETKHIAGTAAMIAGAGKYVLQQFKPSKTLDTKTRLTIPWTTAKLEELRHEALKFVAEVDMRP